MAHRSHPLLASLCLLVSLAGELRSQASGGTGSGATGGIAGIIGDSLDIGIVGATVSVVGAAAVAITAEDGGFRLANVSPGTRVVVARRIGFRPESMTVAVHADSVTSLRMRLTSTAQRVAPVVITASRGRHTGRLRGFNERRDRGTGRFFNSDDIEKRRPRVVTDLLRTLPGTRIGSANGQNVVMFRGMRCPPLVWLDGSPASAGYLDVDLFTPSSLAGIEVYQGPSTVPSEFTMSRGRANCGVIALWTRMPEPRAARGIRLSVSELEALVQSAQLFTADLVDTPAAADSAHPVSPFFPDSLFRASIGGRVVVEFVVDTNGQPNMATFSAVSTTHALFTEAVRGAVSAARFTPAWRGGKRVRQLVQLPFAFAAPGRTGVR